MPGETDLNALLRSLTMQLVEGVFVFATLPQADIPPEIAARMMFTEPEGTTLILLKSQADALGLAYEFPCRMITLSVHSALDAVGFIAHIATRLAAEGMGVNPVAGFYHDHLFVPDGREADALRVLAQIAVEAT